MRKKYFYIFILLINFYHGYGQCTPDETSPNTPTLTDVNVGQCGGTPVAPTTTDICAGTITGTTTTIFPITTQGTTVVTWTFKDDNGNSTTANQNIIVDDTTIPTITAPAAVTGTTNGGCTSTNVVLGLLTVSDNCTATGTLIVTNDAPTAFPIGSTTVTWTVKDAANNIATATQTVTVTDNIAPTITAPVAKTGTTNVGCTSTNVVLGLPTVSDNCTATGSLIVTNNAPTAFPIGITTVTWTVKDAANNTATATQTITVTDNITPTITAPVAKTGTTNLGCTSTNVILGSPTVADNCTATAGLTVTNDAPAAFPIGSTTVTWTVKDAANNIATATQTVTVTDNIAPAITAPVAKTGTTNLGCTSTNVILGSPTVADNCTATAGLTVTNDAPAAFPIGITTVTWTVKDAANNTATATQTVTVTDNIAPTITAPVAKTGTTNVGCTSANVILGSPTVADNCTATAGLTVTNDAPAAFPIGSTTVTWTVKDAANNTATATQTVTVTDNIAPTITAPVAKTGTTNLGCTSTNVILGLPTVSDNCTATAGLTVTNDAPAAFPIGSTTVTWTVKDAANNIATATQTVTVTDNIAPTITAPVAKTGTTNVGCTSTNVILGSPTVADNCTATASLTVTNDAPTAFPIGITTVTWTVKDAANNTATATQTVTVTDNIAPTITAPVAKTGTTNVGCTSTNVILGSPTVADNCTATASLTVTNDAPTAFPIGITTVTWTVKDAANNTATATQTVTVTDNIAPTITAPVAKTGTTNLGCTSTNVILGSPTVADNCTATASLTVTNDAPTAFPIGITTVTWTVKDAANNTATATQTVTVTDNIAPTITAPVAKTGTTNVGCTSTNVILGSPTVADNCTATASLTLTNDAPTAFPIGITTVTWTVKDAANNTATATQTVTVTDNIAPTITAPAATMGTTNVGCTSTNVVLGSPVITDNCTATASLTVTNDAPTAFPIGITTVTWTVKDAANNTATAAQIVTITDNIAPTITAPVAKTGTTNVGCTSTNVILGLPTVSDNCTATASLTVTNDAPAAFPVGITTVTWTVKDAANNSATATQIVTITDIILPTITPGANQSVNTSPGACHAPVTVVDTSFSDNCTATISYTLSGATIKMITAGQVGTYVFNKGVTTINYTVTDASNNSVTGSKTITVIDNELPSITSLPALTGNCSITITAPTSPDNCGTVTGITSDITLPHTYSKPGFYIINWNFTDLSGNSKNISQTVTVTDTNAPVASVTSLPNISFIGCQILSSQLTYPTAVDACNGIITGVPSIQFPYSVLGTSQITWTYTDATGNAATQVQNITMTSEKISGGVLLGYLTVDDPKTAKSIIDIKSCSSGGNEIKMNLSGQIGTIIQWEKYDLGSAVWATIPNTTNNYTVTFYPTTTESTYFRALVQVGTCYQYSSNFYVRALPADQPPVLAQSVFNICLNEQVTLLARRSYTIQEDAITGKGGDFNTGQFPDKFNDDAWRIDGAPSASHYTANGNATKETNWAATNPHEFGTIEYDSGDPKFSIAQGNYYSEWIKKQQPQVYKGKTTLETPIFSLVNMRAAFLNFDQAYNLVDADRAYLDLSIDGGVTYPYRLQTLVGGQTWDWASPRNAGTGSSATTYNFKNDNSSFDLSAYLGHSKVRARWTFYGTTDFSVWAIDGISIPTAPVLDQIEWTDGIGKPGVPPLSQGVLETSYTYTPEAPGKHKYGATILASGCRSYGELGTALADVNVSYSFAGSNITLGPDNCGSNSVKLNAYDNTKTANQNATKGSYIIPAGCTTCDDPGTNIQGTWSISGSSSCGTGTFSDIHDPDATFTAEVGSYILEWTVFGCKSSVNIEISNCATVDFDGVNDYVDFKAQNYHLNSNFSLEVWVKPEASSNNVQTIFSKKNANSNGDNGYDLSIQNDFVTFRWNGVGSITSPNKIGSNRWYHIAVTYANSQYKLYIDGILLNTKTGSSLPNANNFKALIGAMDQNATASSEPVNYFKGWIDELKIWNVALNDEQIRQMMNQEIKEQSAGNNVVFGEVIPVAVNGVTWANLKGYYRMDQIGCGYLKPNFGVGADGKLKNITTAEPQTAPLPYYSVRNGDWTNRSAATPWAYGETVWDYPNSTGINGQPIDWNIVRSLHDINSTSKDITLLGLKSEAGKLTIADPSKPLDEKNSGQGLWITLYLKLNGSIDLVGESQLVQKRYLPTYFNESILDQASTGYIERDQQGQQNSYNYNYWSSPVSIQGGVNNAPYSISGVMRDGTNSASPGLISFNDGAYFADGALSSPIKISNRWIWSYNAPVKSTELQNYNQWNYLGNTGLLKTGEGYTMKGTGGTAATDLTQNYVFVGKPNNGTISLPLPLNQIYLIGNPYPSALDADEFIRNNLKDCVGCTATQNVFNGALYFWDHFGVTNNHVLAQYTGGYAAYNLSGGVAGIANSVLTVHDFSIGSKRPKQYIPVGQSFFIDAPTGTSTSTASLNFTNNQRTFVRETLASSLFIKTIGSAKKSLIDTRSKIRLGFDSSKGMHRQLLVTADPNTTSGYDIGYDAPLFDIKTDDMYWIINNNAYVIQGINNFDEDQIIPLGVVIGNKGSITIKMDELENIADDFRIFLFDNLTESYHNIRKGPLNIMLDIGEYKNRFSLRFKDKTLGIEESILNNDIAVFYAKNSKTLFIQNNFPDVTVNNVTLYNILGQDLGNWDVQNQMQSSIQIPIKNLSSGVYIVKLNTTEGVLSKKIIVN
ncbi:HYR domain-containing protein [Flavobacterium caseinilyticum]|uniref:HYR domain-containing protein n=1 Tax=Flavobacterium caseinilyticum TaxID=2541732 RepID=A0A4R5ATM2_9FLAO|nr:HYR domain-containing protein [Flavobacterium caseinilyticum]TDD75179.1 HYR domain-containing protein [Flavobacterium caseinilyticum]